MTHLLRTCCLLISLAALAHAQEIDIRNIDKTKAGGWSQVDGGWVTNANVLVTPFTANIDIPGALPISAYFFNDSGRLVYRYAKLPQVPTDDGSYQQPLRNLATGRRYKAIFPIPPSVEENGPMRWRTFVIEFGEGEKAIRRAYPSTSDLASLDFTQTPLRGISDVSTESGTSEAVPVIKSVSRFRNSMNAWVDKGWVRGLNTLRAKLRLESGASQGGFFVRAYFFDRDNVKLLEYKKPPQVEVGPGKYATLPTFWKDKEDYEIYFPIPNDKDGGPSGWKTAIVVFGNSKKVVADVTPSNTSLEAFDFPEKANLLAK